MLRVIFKLMVLHPQLLLTHFRNYSILVLAEGSKALMTWRTQMFLYVVSAFLCLMAFFSLSMALLLWAALPSVNPMASWILIAFPCFLLGASGLFFLVAKKYMKNHFLKSLRNQVALDKEVIASFLQASK